MWATAVGSRVGSVVKEEEMVGGAWRGPMKIYDKDLAEPIVLRRSVVCMHVMYSK